LLLDAGRPVTTAALIGRFWRADPPATGRAAIQTHVSELRKLLGPGVIRTTPSGYALELAGHELDAATFTASGEAAHAAAGAGRWEDAVEASERALALWRGTPFQELADDEFARPEIVRLEETRLGLIEARGGSLLELGRAETALPQLEGAALEHPLRERLWELLMTGRARVGRTADALAAFRDLRAILGEMGLEPAPVLRDLETRILREDPAIVASGGSPRRGETRPESEVRTEPDPSPATVAFLFADLAGSTGLLARIGPGAYGELLRDYRAAVEGAVAAEGGRVVDREGDGIFVVVPTAAGAVRAAASAQRRLAETDPPAVTDISVRMGIHVGEAQQHDEGDVVLDINRAARIGALAHGGQVLISEAARLLAADGLDDSILLRDLGEHDLRGIERPERVHQLVAPRLRRDFPPLELPGGPGGERVEDARSVAVLPFEVVGSGEDAEFLASGLHSDLLTELSKVPELTVISRTSVLGYRGTDAPIPRIARELDVGTVIEGAVQAVGSRIRMTVQLIDGIHDAHRWAESYDRELTTENLFDIQTELAKHITESLHAELSGTGVSCTVLCPGPVSTEFAEYVQGIPKDRPVVLY
jgi:TolB-like protein/class 3 adenylate cyclase